MDDKTDHELLILIDERQQKMEVQFDNHLKHHKIIDYTLLGFVGSLIIALIIALI